MARTDLRSSLLVSALVLCGHLSCSNDLSGKSGCKSDGDCLVNEVCGSDSRCGAGNGIQANCSKKVTITNAGVADAAQAVFVDLPKIRGLLPDATNLRFTQGGDDLPFAIDGVDQDTVRTWVRLPVVNQGENVVIASACDAVTNRVDPRKTFEYASVLDDDEKARWTKSCDSIDTAATENRELCDLAFTSATGASAQTTGTLVLTSNAACGTPDGEDKAPGANTFVERAIGAVASGSYVVEAAWDEVVEAYGFCEATRGADGSNLFHLQVLNGADRIDAATREIKLQPGTNVCRTYSADELIQEQITLTAGDVTLHIEADAGDCARMKTTLQNIRLRRVGASTTVNVADND
jgi:hypothetical protein